MPRPLNERQSLEQERAEIPAQIAAYRQELENGRPSKARRERLEWQIREREKRLADVGGKAGEIRATWMRDDFSEDIKRALAARVANQCSNPDCRAVTSGPQTDPSKAVNVGVAAHITAASPGGPRHDPELRSRLGEKGRPSACVRNCS
jgi:hypothetical protein